MRVRNKWTRQEGCVDADCQSDKRGLRRAQQVHMFSFDVLRAERWVVGSDVRWTGAAAKGAVQREKKMGRKDLRRFLSSGEGGSGLAEGE